MRAPILNDQIEAYAAPKLLEHLRADYRKGRFVEDAGYFLKTQDYDASDWMAHISATATGGLPNDPCLLVAPGPVGHAELCVHMVETSLVWKIARVDPASVAPAFADCGTRSSGTR